MKDEEVVKKLREMSVQLAEWSAICDKSATYIQLTKRILELPNCNDCHRQNCEYKPRAGENVRNNCPLWKGSAV